MWYLILLRQKSCTIIYFGAVVCHLFYFFFCFCFFFLLLFGGGGRSALFQDTEDKVSGLTRNLRGRRLFFIRRWGLCQCYDVDDYFYRVKPTAVMLCSYFLFYLLLCCDFNLIAFSFLFLYRFFNLCICRSSRFVHSIGDFFVEGGGEIKQKNTFYALRYSLIFDV